jgi:hypothetical protein
LRLANVVARATLTSIALAAASCRDVPRRPSVETEFFEVHYREDRPPTAEELAALDTHFRIVGMGLLSLPVPERRFDVHLYRDERDFAENAPCWDVAFGCAVGRHAHAPPSFETLFHELVHVYLHERCGSLNDLLNEGLAVALGRLGHDGAVGARDFAEVATSHAYRRAERDGDVDQVETGEFVSWLATWYGLDAVVELACALPQDARRARVEREVEARFGAGLSELYALAAAAPPDRPTAPCAWDALRTRTLALAADEVVEPRLLPEPVWLPAGAVYARVRVGSGNVGGGLFQCGATFGPDLYVWPNEADPEIAVERWGPLFSNGRYTLAAGRSDDAPPSGAVDVALFDRAPLTDACDAAAGAATELRPGFVSIVTSIAGEVVDYPSLDVDGTAVADSAGQFMLTERARIDADARESAWICPAGCATPSPASCTRSGITNSGTSGAAFDPGAYTLVVTWADVFELVTECPLCPDYRKLDLVVTPAP